MDNITNRISQYSEKEFENFCNTEKLSKLHNIKIYADDLYYNTEYSSGLSDWQYDILKESLETRDPKYKVPTGSKIRNYENRAELPFWLGSMDKFKPGDESRLDKWITNNNTDEFIIEDKLDGVSCLLVSTGGKIKLYTRGDGIVGADISYLSQYLSLPKISVDINIRGELIVKNKTFQESYTEKYANTRSMVSGIVGSKTIRDGVNDIDFVAYEIIGKVSKPSEQLKYLKSLGFLTVHSENVKTICMENLMENFIYFRNISKYEIDGIIVQADIPYERNTDGNPEYAFAFKMRLHDNLAQAKVVKVHWGISKWGALKPRIEIVPTKLGGVTNKMATGFNAKFIETNSIGPDSVIEITRSGDTIPYVVRVVKQSKTPDMPVISYKWNDTHVDIFADASDELTNEMGIKLVAEFFSKLNIKYVGEQIVSKMFNAGYNSLLKIISASKQDFEKIPGFGTRLAERTYDNIHNGLSNISISVALGASGVFGYGIGYKKVLALMNGMPNILTLYKTLDKTEIYARIMEIEGFSDKSAVKITDNLVLADEFISNLREFATFKEDSHIEKTVEQNLAGIKIVFTGFRDSVLENKITSLGGQITTSVSKNTKILVVVSKDTNSSKIRKAKELMIEVLDKQEFISKYMDK